MKKLLLFFVLLFNFRTFISVPRLTPRLRSKDAENYLTQADRDKIIKNYLTQHALILRHYERMGVSVDELNLKFFQDFKDTHDKNFWGVMTSRFIKEKIVATWKSYRQI